jgi:2-amino-4-hydroxy-6-hydroxymethyldihydropteridine diphosphokinase
MHPIRRGVLALGSNLGDRMAYLQGAVDSLADTPDVWLTAVSPVYETEPVGAPEGSELFLNAVVLIDTTLPAHTLLDRALAIEDAFDRVRPGEHMAPRTLDVDLITLGDRRADDEFLHLPHPRARERAFVLQPWLDVEPDGVLPDAGPVKQLLETTDTSGITLRDDLSLDLQ